MCTTENVPLWFDYNRDQDRSTTSNGGVPALQNLADRHIRILLQQIRDLICMGFAIKCFVCINPLRVVLE